MRKNISKVITVLLVAIVAMSLTGCNYTLLDTTYNYDYAIIKLPNGEIVEGEVEKWCDYEGEQLQITIDGETYLVSSYNAVMIKH